MATALNSLTLNGKTYDCFADPEARDMASDGIKAITCSRDGGIDIETPCGAHHQSGPITAGGLTEEAQEELLDKLNVGLGAMAKKDAVAKADLTPEVQASLNRADSAMQSYTETDPTVPSWAKSATKPSYSKSEVGLGNVDNVKQYSASNPPPYPVASVNGKTGAVKLSASDVGAEANGTAASAVSAHNADDASHGDIREQISQISAGKVGKNDISLGIASDGLIYIFVNGTPVGTGIPQGQSGDVFGYVDENNVIVLNGNLADGTYSVKYEMENGTVVNVGNMVLDSNVYYSVTSTLTNCTSNNSTKTVVEGGSYAATITAKDGYELKSVVVTMGGSPVSVSGGSISIASVTGNIVITAVAEESKPAYTNLAQPNTTNTTDWEQWCNSARIGSDGGYRSGTLSVTNYIPVKFGDVVRWQGFTIATSNSLAWYKSNKSLCNAGVGIPSAFGPAISDPAIGDLSTNQNGGQFTILDHPDLSGLTYIKLSGTLTGTIDDVIITVNEPIV